MPDLFWLRAIDCADIQQFVGLLGAGVGPNPNPEHPTKRLELHLGIAPPRVYCYLGRTLESFGRFAFAAAAVGLPQGEVSPFDSGGLVGHIAPVKEWEREDQCAFLAANTWPTSALLELLSSYPGREGMRAYLDMERPQYKGPHELWKRCAAADIWSVSNDWRAWTWEGRWATAIPTSSLVAWTCPPAVVPEMMNFFDATENARYAGLLGSYVHGGVSVLIDELRQRTLRT